MQLQKSRNELDEFYAPSSYCRPQTGSLLHGHISSFDLHQPSAPQDFGMPWPTSSFNHAIRHPNSAVYGTSSFAFPNLTPLADYKMPIQPTQWKDSEDSSTQRLPFIFIMSQDGTLDYVHVSIDIGNSFWKTLKPAAASFLRDIEGYDYENVTVHQMKEVLRKYGLNSTGKKSTLVQKLEQVKNILQQLQ
jgi:hypothetical protein